MPSGPSNVVYNSLERLLSTDANRAQAMIACASQQAWRARHNEQRSNWRLYPGVGAQAQTDGAPAYGEVYSGLMVGVDNPSFLTVSPGVAMIIAPGLVGSSDDSPYWFADDPGVPTSFFTFTANATPSTVRWDVFECRPRNQLLESSSRDVYNPATGLFSPASVDKVRAGKLEYRLRLGAPGSGFPGAAAGWLPLCVLAVRDGATGFDKCDAYDVRPLVSERVLPQPAGLAGNEGYASLREAYFQSFATLVLGFSEAEFGGYLAGGALKMSSVPGSLSDFAQGAPGDVSLGGDSPALCYTNPDSLGPVSGGPQNFYHLACLFPRTPGQPPLPRWARYCEAPDPVLGRRVPNGPRGIVLFTTSNPGPNGLFGATSFPASMQLGVPGIGVCLGSLESGSVGGVHAGRRYRNNVAFNVATGAVTWKIAATTLTNPDTAIWNLTPGVHYPPHAKSLRCSIVFQYAGGALTYLSGNCRVSSLDSLGNDFAVLEASPFVTSSSSTNSIRVPEFDLPIPPRSDGSSNNFPYPPPTAYPVDLKAKLFFQAAGTWTSAFLQIHGWEF